MNEIKIYLICGKARTGKNTIAKMIKEKLSNHKVCEIQIMRTLKGYLKDYFGWDGRDETKPRTLLQQMGTELIRQEMNMPNFHIDRLTDDIKVLSNYFDTFIVDDIRLKEEIKEIKNRFNNVVVIYVNKENNENYNLTESEKNHITENDLLDFDSYDYKIENDNINNLEETIDNIIKGGN